MDIYVMSDSA